MNNNISKKAITMTSRKLKVPSEEESITLNRIFHLQIESHQLLLTEKKTNIDYSDAKIAENFFEYMGELNNLALLSHGN